MYIFSPRIHVHGTWTAAKKYISDVMKVDAEKEHIYYEEYDPVALKKIIETKHKSLIFRRKTNKRNYTVF